MSGHAFASLRLPAALLDVLAQEGYTQMRNVQAATIPLALQKKDLIVQAQTGSGKSLAFGIPLLLEISSASKAPQAMVLTPTRELALQVSAVLRRLARFKPNTKIVTLCGGMGMRAQMDSLAKGVDVIVGTPGRVLDHLGKGTLVLSHVKVAVLDEADRMLEMGFYDAIFKIFSHLPSSRQTLLFSATFSPKILGLCEDVTTDAQHLQIHEKKSKRDLKEYFYRLEKGREEALLALLSFYAPKRALVFANTKEKVVEITHFLQSRGFSASDLQGGLSQEERIARVVGFENGSCRVLVATDIAARGLDIVGVDMVINYEMPHKEENYVHRIGRSARSGAKGVAVSFTSQKGDDFPQEIQKSSPTALVATHKTVVILGGKRQKVRAGDVVGALVKEVGIGGEAIGKIVLFENRCYVGIEKEVFVQKLKDCTFIRIKKRKFKLFSL